MTYQVQIRTMFGWLNTCTDDNGATYTVFDTFEDANQELQDLLEDLSHAVQAGYMEDFNPQDYRIAKVAP